MIALQTKGQQAVGLQTYVFVDEQLFKVGSQRIADAYGGRRAEPALAGKAAVLYSTVFREGTPIFGAPAPAVFDEQGQVREDVKHWALLAKMDNVPVQKLLREKVPSDAQVDLFLRAVSNLPDAGTLAALAVEARTLSTK